MTFFGAGQQEPVPVGKTVGEKGEGKGKDGRGKPGGAKRSPEH